LFCHSNTTLNCIISYRYEAKVQIVMIVNSTNNNKTNNYFSSWLSKLNIKKNSIYDVGNINPGLGKTHKYGGSNRLMWSCFLFISSLRINVIEITLSAHRSNTFKNCSRYYQKNYIKNWAISLIFNISVYARESLYLSTSRTNYGELFLKRERWIFLKSIIKLTQSVKSLWISAVT
jgi:hypothetical protein